MTALQTRVLPRNVIAEFIPSPRGVLAFEAAQKDVTNNYDLLSGGAFLTLGPIASLDSERVLDLPAGELEGVDGGPNTTYTLGLADTAVIAGDYGDVSHTVTVSIDAKGRIIGASNNPLTTTNITEGSNLYYTDARARLALSGGSGIAYDSGAGTIALAAISGVAGTHIAPTSITVNGFGQITAIS
jgi:hypothetical protein